MRSFAFLFLALAACPSSEDRPDIADPSGGIPTGGGRVLPTAASFADASAEERVAAVRAALGFGAVHATVVQRNAAADAVDRDGKPTDCPTVHVLAEEPLTLRYKADACTAPSGAAYDGALQVTNPFGGHDEAGRGGAIIIAAEGFSTAGVTLDGTWSRSETAPERDAVTRFDLAVTMDGLTARLAGGTELLWERGVGRTVCAKDLQGAVDGLGDFAVSCDMLDMGGPLQGGYVELEGADALRVSLAPDLNGCLPAAVDGVPVAPICLNDGGGLDDTVFAGSRLGCKDDAIVLDAHTVAAAAGGVEIALAAEGTTPDEVEIHTLGEDPEWTDAAYDRWRLALASGDYEEGVSSALACDDLGALHAVYFAYDADGEVLGCRIAGGARDAGPIDVSECPRD